MNSISNQSAWLKPKAGAVYAGVGEKTFRGWMKAGLRFVRLPSGSILTKRDWIDDFLCSFEPTSKPSKVDQIVSDVLRAMR